MKHAHEDNGFGLFPLYIIQIHKEQININKNVLEPFYNLFV